MTTAPLLVKTRRVLHLPWPRPTENQADMVEFLSLNDDNPQLLDTTTRITYGDWVELGKPETITLTIEPGDNDYNPPD